MSTKQVRFISIILNLTMIFAMFFSPLAQSIVIAANASASLDQCGNDPAPSLHTDGCNTSATQWENGNLGASKSVYIEGDSIPYRMLFDNLDTAAPHTVTIEWDTTKSSKHAIDYLTTFNQTVADANPCLGVSGCSASSTFAIPIDPQVTGGGVTPISGVFTIFGGTISSVSAYSYANGTGFIGDMSARITITFTTTVVNPVLAWGGHIATRADWGQTNSAISISGSPYHTRLIDLDGSGGNQDRSLSAEAVIFPASITIIKDATPNGSTSFPFTASPSPLTGFSLVDDGTIANTKLFSGITNFTSYAITENTPAGWSLTGVDCSVTDANGGSHSFSGATETINLKEGEHVTCTFSNLRNTGSLKITKSFDPLTSGFIGTFAIDYDCNDGTAHDGTVNLAAGASSTISGIPTGTQCTVSEPALPTAPSGWTFGVASISPAQPVTINSTTIPVEVTVTNSITRDQGYLKLSKVFDPLTSGFTGAFAIVYNCGAGDITVNLNAGTSTTVGPFDTGTSCDVSEPSLPTAPTGWTFGVPVIATSPAIIVKGNQAAAVEVTVTNSITRDLGNLKIAKTVSNPDGATLPSTFTVNYDCGGTYTGSVNVAGGSFETVTGIPTGSVCSVTEVAPTPITGYTWGTITYTPSSVTISAKGGTFEIVVGNSITRDRGSLKITKSFDPLTSGFVGTFAINYDCDDGTAHDGTVDLAAGASSTISGIPTGTQCTVSEPALPTAPTGWTFGAPSISPVQPVTINSTTIPVEVTVTNSITRDQGYLKLTKVFDPLTSGFAGTFAIVYNCGAGDQTVNLDAGTSTTVGPFDTGTSCAVSEPALPTAPTGWTFGAPVIATSPAIIVKGNQAAAVEVTVTNSITRDQGYLKLTKVFDPLTSGFIGTFTIVYNCGAGDQTVDLAAGASTTVGPFDTGTSCAVSEPALPTAPTGWTFGAPVIATSPAIIVKGNQAAAVEVTVTNLITRDQGYLKLTKVFDPLTSGFAGTFAIVYNCGAGDQTVDLSAGASTTVGPFDTGTSCAVSEPALPTAPTGWTFGVPVIVTSPAIIVKGNQAAAIEVTVTNSISRDLGSLKIIKSFDPLTSGFSGTFAINYDCDDGTAHDGTVDLAAGASSTISGIPTGTECTVTEPVLPTAPTGWTFGTASISPSQPVTINSTTVAVEVTVTNSITRDQGYLKLSKVFDPLTSGFTGTFAIVYNCGAGDQTAFLNAGGSITVGPFDTGTSCAVSEPVMPNAPTGWTFGVPSIATSPAIIVKGNQAAAVEVVVTNSITRDLGNLKITKTVSNPDGATLPATFTVNYDCGGTYTGQVSVAYPTPGFITVPDIPTGSICTLTEVAPDPITGYTWGTITYTPATITIDTKGETFEIVVGNSITRDQGYLKLSKVFDPLTSGFTGTFAIVYNCGAGDQTAFLNAGGSITVGPFDTGTSCAISEPVMPNAPTGWTFGIPLIETSPAIIVKGGQTEAVEVVVTNHIIKEHAALLPTQTTCQMYAAGPSAWPPMYDAFSYMVKDGMINSLSPGVIFYYNTITAPSASFVFTVVQNNTLNWKPMLVQTIGQAILYDTNCNKTSSAQVTATITGTNTYTVMFDVTGVTSGATYYIGIKYSPQNLKGQAVVPVGGIYPTSDYSFYTAFNNIMQLGSDVSIPVKPK